MPVQFPLGVRTRLHEALATQLLTAMPSDWPESMRAAVISQCVDRVLSDVDVAVRLWEAWTALRDSSGAPTRLKSEED